MGRRIGSKNKILKRERKICLYCKQDFLVYHYLKKIRKFCSHLCANKYSLEKETIRKKLSLANRGKIPKNIKMIAGWNKGTKGIMKAWNKGLKGYMAGRKHYNWQNGKSFEPYNIEFNKELKEKIRKRDDYKCQECGEKQKDCNLSIHHIDYNKKNSQESNLITLCRSCNSQANFKRSDWMNYFKNKLKKIYVYQ